VRSVNLVKTPLGCRLGSNAQHNSVFDKKWTEYGAWKYRRAREE
jgi:hypothetical protein